MLAGADAVGICFLEFVDIGQIEAQLERLRRIFEPPFFLSKSPLISRLQAQLDEYFAGERCHFTVPLSMVGTPFQKQVWEALIAIPYGETRSYQAQANALGNPAAIRAVARANGDNRIPILVPCHRVIGKDGKLTGYAGGLWRKEYLLALEGRQINAA
ncbi:MAG: methylated-DNA--[protein]-cysteine S-methyltransferase [Anaerolineaceae bacterium]|nr:methylated-DNA--[protein]-cysteine S-methyltransferase [Anaerolineaceae bacterium]